MDGGMETGREGLALSSFTHIYLQTSGHFHDHLRRHVPFLYFQLSSLKFDYNVPKLAEQFYLNMPLSLPGQHTQNTVERVSPAPGLCPVTPSHGSTLSQQD